MCFYVGNDIYYLRELEDDLCGLTRTRYLGSIQIGDLGSQRVDRILVAEEVIPNEIQKRHFQQSL
jgi:hypothetical protein